MSDFQALWQDTLSTISNLDPPPREFPAHDLATVQRAIDFWTGVSEELSTLNELMLKAASSANAVSFDAATHINIEAVFSDFVLPEYTVIFDIQGEAEDADPGMSSDENI